MMKQLITIKSRTLAHMDRTAYFSVLISLLALQSGLGGTSRISGNVIVGEGNAPEAFLTPGLTNGIPAALTIQRKLTFRADGTDHFGYKSNGIADKVVARGVAIQSGALLFFGPIDT